MGETDVKPERPKQQHLNMLVKHIMSDFESYAINVLIPMFINQVFNKYSVFSVPAVTMYTWQMIPVIYISVVSVSKGMQKRLVLTDGLIRL